MKLIGFKNDEITGVYTLLGAILHLGNVLFQHKFIDGMDSVDVLNENGNVSHNATKCKLKEPLSPRGLCGHTEISDCLKINWPKQKPWLHTHKLN